MKTTILIYIIILTISSCANRNSTRSLNELQNNTSDIDKKDSILSIGKYYFNFDNITYYHSDISAEEIHLLLSKENETELTTKEKEIIDIVIGGKPKTLNDTSFIAKFKEYGYNEIYVSKRKYNEINEIFREKKHNNVIGTGCIYEYRDILIFRRKGKIIGLAKICVKCLGHLIIGTTANTEEFGQSGEYEKLIELLEKK